MIILILFLAISAMFPMAAHSIPFGSAANKPCKASSFFYTLDSVKIIK